jgi:hypothetical protein
MTMLLLAILAILLYTAAVFLLVRWMYMESYGAASKAYGAGYRAGYFDKGREIPHVTCLAHGDQVAMLKCVKCESKRKRR